jgi:hypothetical protein
MSTMIKASAFAASLAVGLLVSSAYAGEIQPKPGQVFLPQVGLDKVQSINNPTPTLEQQGAVLESHDVPVKQNPPSQDSDDGN